MTKRDFFRIIIKLFALYSASIAIFSLMPTYFGYAINADGWISIILAVASFLLILAVLITLIYGADKIIDLLRLDKGFDEERIEFGKLKEINILKIAIIVIAGLLIIDNIPYFLNQCYLAFKDKVSTKGMDGMLNSFTYEQADYFQLIVSAISLLIGYLMITNYTNVANWLEKTDKSNIL